MEKIGIIHLYTLGYRDEDLTTFRVSLNNPSKIAELQELEHWKSKFDIASSATEGFFSKRWLAEKLFGISDEEFVRNRRELFYDRRFEASLETAGEMEQAAATPSGGMDMGGGDMMGDMSEPGGTGFVGAEPELGAPTGDAAADAGAAGTETPATPPAGGGEEGDLLAAPPGKREDSKGRTTTAKSHGWYTPRASKGGDRRSGAGPRKKQMKAAGSIEKARPGRRNTLPGASELLGLGKGIYEEKDSIYKEEEMKILNSTSEVKKLFESLQMRDNK